MKLTASMVYDIALMLLIIYIVWRGWEQGMVSELLRLAGWLAALMLEGLTVVVSPLISLMKDQVTALARTSLAKAIPIAS